MLCEHGMLFLLNNSLKLVLEISLEQYSSSTFNRDPFKITTTELLNGKEVCLQVFLGIGLAFLRYKIRLLTLLIMTVSDT